MSFTLSSPDFADGGAVPVRCTGDGSDVSPALRWTDAPAGTRAFALVVDDPDAPDPAKPRRTWVHWVVCDLPSTTSALPEGASRSAMPAGSREGRNDSGGTGYEGPCPPIGRHRYVFSLYALDSMVALPEGHTKAELLRAIEGHVLAKSQLTGTYARRSK